jgi:DNA-binding NarL/FixJ family response regulator
MYIEEQDFQELMNAVKDLMGAVDALSGRIQAKITSDGHRPPDHFQDRFRSVFALHEQGHSIDEIARKLKLDKGEVQLIFNVSRKI